MVNVISGASKTGKSAMIPIIDYCLGSEKCTVPVGVIRESCSWFGIVVDTAEGQKLLARREPGIQQSTGDMVLLEAREIELPKKIDTKTTNVDYVKAVLNRLAGLSNLEFEPGTEDRYKYRPSFRDLMAFTFQPQNIVANPNVMFFKADITEHREKLKTIFPYVLGAVSSDILQARHELDRLSRQLRRKESELRARQASGAVWQGEAQVWVRQAIEYGLLPPYYEVPDDWSTIIDTLRDVLGSDVRGAVPTLGGMDVVMARLAELRGMETALAVQLNQSRQRLHELGRLDESSDAYGTALRVQRDRLALSKWIRGLIQEESDVVFELNEAGRERLGQLCGALDAIEVRLRSHPGITETLGKETLRQRETTQVVLEKLHAVRQEIRALEGKSNEATEVRERGERVERFLGRLEESLRLYDAADLSSGLSREIAELQVEIERLKALVAEHEIARKLTNALDTLQKFAGLLVPKLDGEWPEAPVRLIISELTVKVIRGTRDDYLWEIGSGANWLAYHVAITLALQAYFLKTPNHPVPGLLIYDQPSQVYFPVSRAGDKGLVQGDPKWHDEDVIAVRKVFDLLAKVTQKAAGKMQVIVLDHANEDVWGKLPNTRLVEEWRGDALVPAAWMSGSQENA
ncbi:DUF3732 domain-containing protein [Paenalcaligenes sp. Me52]|uniref:DUF3732 domain-containing protein n=1 Tax=Paenalcaligenes sp. Me52 TaxID=3392038 RepID=UPI003D28B412